MIAPCNSILDSEPVVPSNLEKFSSEVVAGKDESLDELDVTETLFATLLTDIVNPDNSDLCSDIMSLNSDSETECDDILEYLSKTKKITTNDVLCSHATTKQTDCMQPARLTRSVAKTKIVNDTETAMPLTDFQGSKQYSRQPLMCSSTVNMKAPNTVIDGKTSLTKDDNSNNTGNRDVCMSKNAIIARENREKKKKYMSLLEINVEELKAENFDLKTKFSAKTKQCESLETEVHYLRNVLANQSCISALLKNIHATQGVSFTSSLETADIKDEIISKKRSLDENDNCENTSKGIYVRATGFHKRSKPEPGTLANTIYSPPPTPCSSPNQDEAGGVCLHVSNNKVSLELCSLCAESASNAWNKAGDHNYFKS